MAVSACKTDSFDLRVSTVRQHQQRADVKLQHTCEGLRPAARNRYEGAPIAIQQKPRI
jgi:hypothetical protein